MRETTNKYGLSRYIPEPVKRQVRQECGFGCVVCGNAIAQYEHIDPEFKDAKYHDPSKIAYLCAQCHDKVTRQIWSKSKIKTARKNPVSFSNGLSRDVLDIDAPFTLMVGDNVFNTNIILTIAGHKLLYLERPEEEGEPARFTGHFYGSNGETVFAIYRNEISVPNTAWDCKIEGSTFTIQANKKETVLEFVVEPPHLIKIEKLNMTYKGTEVKLKGDGLFISMPDGQNFSISGCHYYDVKLSAINIDYVGNYFTDMDKRTNFLTNVK